jgi:plastocyanin
MQEKPRTIQFPDFLVSSLQAALVAIAVLPAGLARADEPAPTGTITGIVRYLGEVPPTRRIVTTDGAIIEHNDVVVSKNKGLRDVAVMLAAGPARPVSTEAVVIDQRDQVFVPRVVVVQAGRIVRFENNDLFNHAVKADSTKDENSFNTITPPNKSYEHRFKAQKAPVMIGCPIHAWMRAWIYVTPHPFAAVTYAQGRFRIADVPAGQQTLIFAHPDTGFRDEIMIEVPAGRTTEVVRALQRLEK